MKGTMKGKIWPEYWIDCCKCDRKQSLSASKSPATAAKKQKWSRFGNSMYGPWICPVCQKAEDQR